MKQCARCKKMKDESEFYKPPQSYCKECFKIIQREWSKTPKGIAAYERTKERLREKYNNNEEYRNTISKRRKDNQDKDIEASRRRAREGMRAYRERKRNTPEAIATRERKEELRIAEKQRKKEERRIRVELEREERMKAFEDKRTERINAESLTCVECKELKPNNEFWRYKNGLPRRKCKSCQLKDFAMMKKGKSTGKKPQKVIQAWKLVSAAIYDGVLTRPDSCPKCGSTHRIQAHHEDYDKPYDVLWMCESCHKDLHVSLRISKQTEQS